MMPSKQITACFLAALLLIAASCRRYNTQQAAQNMDAQTMRQKEVMILMNQLLIEKEIEEIEAFVGRRGWKMQTTDTGLWYQIYRKGKGAQVMPDQTVTLACTLSLLDSTVCYSSEELGTKTFQLGQGTVETGLEEGVLLMHAGDKARFIMPPHLAYGYSGNGSCIPPRTIILYDVELLQLK